MQEICRKYFPVPGSIVKWIIFLGLCLIWGSSFMLMKWGMYDSQQQPVLSPYHVAALRMLSAGVVMLPFFASAVKRIDKKNLSFVLLSGWLGSFFPAFLFCIAETRIDGALSGCLNALTPLFAVVTGSMFFQLKTTRQKIVGVTIGFIGCVLLLCASYNTPLQNLTYTGFVIIATFMYGINVNMVHTKLRGLKSIHIAAVTFTALIPFSLVVLFFSGFFEQPLNETKYLMSTGASCLLGIMGTAVATILFYMLVKRAGGLFASLVTYGIPFVAIGWGIVYHEQVTYLHVVALVIILVGVYITNKQ